MKLKLAVKQFPDGESYVRILNLSKINKIKNQKVEIFYRLYPEPDKRIFELLLILSRLQHTAKSIELLVPYLPYARQDRENKPGEAVSADVLCKLLKSAGVKKLITYDCHFLPRPGNFKRAGLPIENRSAGKILFSHAKKFFKKEKFVVISPDEGASYFTELAQGHSLKKTRLSETQIHKMEGEIDVKGKNVCILDDIISTGGTIIHCIKHLKDHGAKKIIVGVTHGVFAGGSIAEKILQSGCAHLFVTDTILESRNFIDTKDQNQSRNPLRKRKMTVIKLHVD